MPPSHEAYVKRVADDPSKLRRQQRCVMSKLLAIAASFKIALIVIAAGLAHSDVLPIILISLLFNLARSKDASLR